jgi:hypothetical protein
MVLKALGQPTHCMGSGEASGAGAAREGVFQMRFVAMATKQRYCSSYVIMMSSLRNQWIRFEPHKYVSSSLDIQAAGEGVWD